MASWRPSRWYAKAAVVALHLLPGALAYWLLRRARIPLQREFGLSSAEAQIGVIMTGVMVAMAMATFVLSASLDRLRWREILKSTGVTRLDPTAFLWAVALWVVVLVVPPLLGYEEALRDRIEDVSWLDLPPWHFQRDDGFTSLAPPIAGVALLANLICEELWFRGYLQDKVRFLGRFYWAGAGALFSLYHVFQAPVAYPGVAGALALAGLWALRRDLWSFVLLHALLQAA